MRYDDRLATVLRLPVGGQAFARIQWRQLVDLLGTAPAEARGDNLDAAQVRLAELAGQLPAATRAAILRDPGLRLRSPRLVAGLAAGEPQVARAALSAAQLSEDQWRDLVPALPASARVQLAGRRDLPASARALLGRLGATGLSLPGETTPEPVPEPAAQPATRALETAAEITGIGAIVKRIEAFRRAREDAKLSPPDAETPPDSPRLPLGEEAPAPASAIASFDFATDAAGRIVWAEPQVAPMVVGTPLSEQDDMAAAIARYQPIRAAALTLGGAAAIAGTWQTDAAPRFAPVGGRFIGHIGRCRRASGALPAAPSSSESDRLRQMLHELRTPVNAIQGFAEIIQQQLFGPTPHEYRALAAAIAGDAAHMLAGFEELERFARLDTGAMAPEAGQSDLAACINATTAQLSPHTAPREAGFRLEHAGAHMVALVPAETERLCWRLLATLAAHLAPGEVLPLFLSHENAAEEVVLRLPAALAALDDAALFHAAASPARTMPARTAPSAGMFGTGFALRLAATEAHAAGGNLRRKGEWLCMSLPSLRTNSDASSPVRATPDLTQSAPGHSAGPQVAPVRPAV